MMMESLIYKDGCMCSSNTPPDFSKKNLPPFLRGRWKSPLERGDLGVCKTQKQKTTTLPPNKGG